MTRLVNQEIETKVQVIDANGDPVTGAVVSYKVLDEADVSFVTGAMTHVGDGIYSCTWEPDEKGEWTVECSVLTQNSRRVLLTTLSQLRRHGGKTVGEKRWVQHADKQPYFGRVPYSN